MDTSQVIFMYGININKSINVSKTINDFLDQNNIITINKNIHHIIGDDPYKGQKKKLFILKNNKVIRVINEYKECLTSNLNKDDILLNKQYVIINNNLAGGSHEWFLDLKKCVPCFRVSRSERIVSIYQEDKE